MNNAKKSISDLYNNWNDVLEHAATWQTKSLKQAFEDRRPPCAALGFAL